MDLDKLQQHSNFVFALSIFFMFITSPIPNISKTIAFFVFLPSGILCAIIELYKIFSNK
jgi:hypothetical protein